MTTNYSGSEPSDAVPGPGQTPVQGFFAWIRRLGLVRSAEERILGGVAAALARKVGLEPWVMRLILVLLVVIAGVSVWFYVAAWILLPDGRTGSIPLERWIS